MLEDVMDSFSDYGDGAVDSESISSDDLFVYDDDSSVDYEQRGDLYDGLAATSNNRRLASDHGLAVSRRSGKYPSFLAPTGPVTKMDPEVNDYCGLFTTVVARCIM
jgi:hypothetical protein